jgi:predicted TIM-barrel fold metal-dependent hydrolase
MNVPANIVENDMPIVDTHVHVFERDMPLVNNPRHRPTYDFTTAQLLEVMDQHRVGHAVIAAASPWGDYNDYVVAAVRQEPRLRGTVILEPDVERVVLDDMAAAGVVGVRLPFISMSTLPDLTSWGYRKLLRRLRDLDWHVHLHLDGPRLTQVLPALEESGVKLVIDHIGRPDPDTGIDSEGFKATVRSVEKGRTWVKLSGAYRLGANARACAQELHRRVGHEKLMWASDCPFVGAEGTFQYADTIEWLRQTITDPLAQRKIFGENALAFYFS